MHYEIERETQLDRRATIMRIIREHLSKSVEEAFTEICEKFPEVLILQKERRSILRMFYYYFKGQLGLTKH